MRKPAAILLLLLMLFNLVGYKAIFFLAEQRADEQLEASIELDTYNDDDLITITIPLSNPYQLSDPDFERAEGELTIGGTNYKYVKRKISGTELVLLCIPNNNKTQLKSASNEYFKFANAVDSGTDKSKADHSKAKSFKNFSADFLGTGNAGILTHGADSTALNYFASLSLDPISIPHLVPDHPPEI